jgi:hypothetical protein
MVETRRAHFPIAVLLCLLSVPAGAAEKKDFDARWKEAQQTISGGAGEQYFTVLFVKEFFGKYAVHMTKCSQRTGQIMKEDLTAAIQLGARGQVLAVMVRPESKLTKCFANLVKRDTFSPPPSAHFWLPVTIRFTGGVSGLLDGAGMCHKVPCAEAGWRKNGHDKAIVDRVEVRNDRPGLAGRGRTASRVL